jgi:hypothetical protein
VQGSNLNPLESLTPPLTKRLGFANQKDPGEAQHQARFKADMAPSRELHEAEKVAGDAVEHKLLMELLVQPAAEKSKKAEARCDHGRRKRQCKDCGRGQCKHGRQKGKCKECGTGQCKHGLWKSNCKHCGTNK